MEIGIVGLPNVGKSTIFNILTKANAEVANYPFCTIEPNIGIVPVKDERLEFLYHIYNKNNNTKLVYSTVKFVDIAGLVKGASKGEGLGNKFLSHIREVDAIAHVVRTFSDSNIAHHTDKVNPLEDIEIINTELILSDLETINKNLERLNKKVKSHDKDSLKKYNVLEKIKDYLEKNILIKNINLTEEEKNIIKEYNFLTIKPVLYVFNTDEEKIKNFEAEHPELIEYVKKQNSEYEVICAKIESEISLLDEEEKKEFIKELGFDYKGFDEFIKKSYKLLNLITFFTAGEKECHAWSIKRGTTIEKAAGKIHSDMERGFIRAEVIKFKDFKEYKSEAKLREKGLIHIEGKGYIVEDGDIIYIRFNV